VKRILITCTAIAALGLALAASRNGVTADSVTVRIDNAIHDLEKVHAPIPHTALHAKALEILRGRVVASEDNDLPNSQLARDLGAEELERLESCIAFKKTPLEYSTCK
jgi:hypothetical protein